MPIVIDKDLKVKHLAIVQQCLNALLSLLILFDYSLLSLISLFCTFFIVVGGLLNLLFMATKDVRIYNHCLLINSQGDKAVDHHSQPGEVDSSPDDFEYVSSDTLQAAIIALYRFCMRFSNLMNLVASRQDIKLTVRFILSVALINVLSMILSDTYIVGLTVNIVCLVMMKERMSSL